MRKLVILPFRPLYSWGKGRHSILAVRLALPIFALYLAVINEETADTLIRIGTVTILLVSGGYYRCLGEIRYWAVAWNAGGRSDLGLDNFQHREHTDAGQSPGASLWSRLCMWSRIISRKAVQTDLSPCLSVRWPV